MRQEKVLTFKRTKRILLIAGICILSLLCGCQKKEEIKTEIRGGRRYEL